MGQIIQIKQILLTILRKLITFALLYTYFNTRTQINYKSKILCVPCKYTSDVIMLINNIMFKQQFKIRTYLTL